MAAPQLRLEVSLNLAGFRGEIQKLTNIAQSEFAPKINVKFNRQTLDTELNNLQAAIKRRTYRVQIGGNIDTLPDKIKALKEQLASLESFKIDLGVGAVKSLSKKDAKKIATDLRAQIVGEQKKIYVGVGATAELTGEEARKVVANLRAQIVGEKKKIVVGVGAIKALSNENAQAISTAISTQVAGKKGAVLIPASIVTSITGDDVAAFKSTVKEKLSGIKIKVGIEAQVPGAGTGATPASGERKRSAGYEAALQSISGLQVEQLRRRAFSSLGEESRTAQQVSNWLNTIVSEGLQGKAKTSQLTAVREFLADALATAAGRNIEARMQPLRGQTSIEAARSATNINKILDPIAQYTQKPEAAQQMLRMLPESRISTNTLDIASKQARYYEAVPGAESFQSGIKGFDPLLKSIAKDFTEYTKSLSPTNPWIGKISDGIANMVSSAAVPLQTQKLLPAAGQSSASRMTRSLFAGLPPIQAPSIGQENAPLSAGATRSLNKARRLLGMPIGPVSSYVSNPWAGSATVPPVTTASPSRGLPVAGSLPPAGATSNYGVAAQAQAMAQATQQFGFMRAPSMPPSLVRPSSGGPPTPPIPPRGGGGGGGGSFGGMQFNMPKLPGAGLVREIGEEFGFAAKQVLLYGTAYKALGLLQTFPAQVGEAVGALQSFRNTLNAISPTAQEAAASSEFILNIVDKYNVPLQSARDGFTKLYASMAPTGFSGNEIRDLFTGISQAAATFGMSSDKVDRVTYAFAQMASKGQVMSEELKGQLGDVLPGAMGIFAKAAGFEGADAIQKFGKALEDGAYKGKPMRDLLKNVTIELKKEFGPGAEGAARTYQGVMTRMANSTKLLYESFEPVAINFLNSIVVPITGGLKTVTDGFKAFFTGQAAQTAGGSAFAKQLEGLRPTFEGLVANIKQVLPVLESFGKTALALSTILLQIAGNPFVGYLARIYLSVLPVTMALRVLNLQALIPLIGSFLKAIPAFISFQGAMMSGVSTNKALIATMQLTGQTAGITAGKIRLIGAALATLGTAVVLGGIGLLIERFLMMKSAIDGVKQSTQQMLVSISGMANSGAVKELQNVSKNIQKQKDTFNELKKFVSGGGLLGGGEKELTQEMADKFKEVGMGSFVVKSAFGKPIITDFIKATEIIDAKLQGLNKESSSVAEKLPMAQRIATDIARQAKTAESAASSQGATGEDETNKKKTSLESYYSLQDQLAKAQTQADIERLEAAFEHARAMVNAEYDLKEAKANSFQKKAIAFQREIFAITSEQDAALFKNRSKVLAAAGSVAGGAGGGGKGLGVGIAQYITGDPASPFYKADHGGGNYHEHLAFVSREAAEEAYKKLTSAGIKVTEFQGKSKVGGHTPGSAHYEGLAFDVPASQVPVGKERELTARVQSILGIGGGGTAPGKVTPSRKRDELAEQQVALTAREANAANIEKEAEATAKLEIATANYVQSLLPTAEQSLQNQLLQQRITLTQNSFSPEILEAQLAFAEQELQVAENITKNTEEINRLTTASGNNTKQINALTNANNQLKANLPVSAIQLLTKAIDDQVLSLVQRTKTAKQDAADQERVNSLIIGGMTRQAAEAKVTAENLRSDYKKALEEATRQVEIAAAAEEVLAAARRLGKKETAEQTAEYNRLAKALKDAKDKKDALEGKAPQVEGAATGVEGSAAPKTTSSYIADGLSAAQEKLDQLTNTGYQVVQAANAIGDAFGTAFKGVITGSMTAREALAGMFQSVADHFADMVAQMIAEYLKMALIKGIMSIIGGAAGALGGGLSSGFNAGTSSAIDTGASGWASSFATPLKFANGGIAPGGFTAFANGGVVTGPTLGLVGEGRYNEAVIPLPDGKSVPVQLSGGDGGSQINSNITVNVSNGQAQSNATGSNSSELGRKLEGAVKQVIVGELRPGGLLASR